MLAYFFRRYQELASENKFKSLMCFNKEHGELDVFFEEDTDRVKLMCFVCNYSIKPGLDLYNEVIKRVRIYENENNS